MAATAALPVVLKNPARPAEDDVRMEGVPAHWTVRQLKRRLQEEYPGNPPERRQKLIYAGAILDDDAVLAQVAAPANFSAFDGSPIFPNGAGEGASSPASPAASPAAPNPLILHLIVAADPPPATPVTATPAPTPTTPTPAPAQTPPAPHASPVQPFPHSPPPPLASPAVSPALEPFVTVAYQAAYEAALATLCGAVATPSAVAGTTPLAAAPSPFAAAANPAEFEARLAPNADVDDPVVGAAAAAAAANGAVVRVIRIDLRLIAKLVVLVFVLNQDGSQLRFALFSAVAILIYMHQAGALDGVGRRIARYQQRVLGLDPGAPTAPAPTGLLQEAKVFVIGFISSLLPGFQVPRADDAAPLAEPGGFRGNAAVM